MESDKNSLRHTILSFKLYKNNLEELDKLLKVYTIHPYTRFYIGTKYSYQSSLNENIAEYNLKYADLTIYGFLNSQSNFIEIKTENKIKDCYIYISNKNDELSLEFYNICVKYFNKNRLFYFIPSNVYTKLLLVLIFIITFISYFIGLPYLTFSVINVSSTLLFLIYLWLFFGKYFKFTKVIYLFQYKSDHKLTYKDYKNQIIGFILGLVAGLLIGYFFELRKIFNLP